MQMKTDTITSKQVHNVLANVMPKIQSKVDRISWGGCGEFSLELSRALRAKGKKCSVVLVDLGYDEDDVFDMLNVCDTKSISTAWNRILSEGSYSSLKNGHIAVKYGNKLYDDSGDITGEHIAISGAISDKVLSKAIKDDGHWNGTFKSWNEGMDTRAVFKKYLNRVLKAK